MKCVNFIFLVSHLTPEKYLAFISICTPAFLLHNKGNFVFKNKFQTFVLKISGIQK